LDWGFVDHPPLSIVILAAVRALLGDSLLAIRLLPVLLGGITVILTGLMAREMGGGRSAQGLAAVAALTTLVNLALCSYYSMNAIDWVGPSPYLSPRLNGADRRVWLLLASSWPVCSTS
jgi:predicted membrane-bound dolichyl-phosphate-mannose-protein mannosyltransferase